ncbi:carbohydrate ABC transporter permease [Halalkalibacter hemicellulosilyticus]|uniref:Multiple sugar-binding transport system permease n=1 Tax=Halalkalibacter hemicellulosilyticusJCM 9152 TaxID=1236971 RepID=W4Q9V8_9BACI|nr:carbohydrate ABC transporter permease [Halalkalibacter hemicellulosilyticus]GAE28841.1 multiple sugar-binding transport system permease [Halalkalibacter hemicellulosilyticusJCM 9152]
MRTSRVAASLNTIILVLFGALTLFPIYLAVVNSFKTQSEIFSNVLALPTSLNFDNYINAMQQVNFFSSMWNTVIVTTIGLLGIIVCGSLAGYKLARTKSKLSSLFFLVFIASMLIPFHSIMITLTQVANNIGVQGSPYGLGLIYIGLGVNMAIFLCHGFTKTIPKELEESAKIDGANEIQIFMKIIFPMLTPILVTIAILNILWLWNDFLLPLLMLTNVNNYTLILAINMLFGEYNNDWPQILSALVITALPLIIFYLVFQRFILHGIAEGAVKG